MQYYIFKAILSFQRKCKMSVIVSLHQNLHMLSETFLVHNATNSRLYDNR
jgi:hypothetical protein